MARSSDDVLRWTCPFCGRSGINTEATNNTGAQGALRSHIYATGGDGHGPELAFPEEFDPETLTEHLYPEDADQPPVDG